MGKIANRQSLAFSERSQLSQAIPQLHVEQMLNEWTPIARFESQHNECRVCQALFLCFRGRYDCQQTLAIRIAATTLTSDSAITVARSRPSKVLQGWTFRLCPAISWGWLYIHMVNLKLSLGPFFAKLGFPLFCCFPCVLQCSLVFWGSYLATKLAQTKS